MSRNMSDKIKILEITQNKSRVCEDIIRSLPEWFGLEKSIQEYVKNVSNMPMFVAKLRDDAVIGFIAIKFHNKYSAEIYVIGVKKEYHRRGIGKLLIAYVENYLRSLGYDFFTVKTLSDSVEYFEYEKTRKFYQNVGFKPLEELPNFWDEENPCLLMIKTLQ